MAHDVKATWQTVDSASLPANLKAEYDAYKEAYAFAKEARESFEKAMSEAAKLPSHERLVFGYNFGKLSVAVVPNEQRAKVDRNAVSLADWLATKRATGSRA